MLTFVRSTPKKSTYKTFLWCRIKTSLPLKWQHKDISISWFLLMKLVTTHPEFDGDISNSQVCLMQTTQKVQDEKTSQLHWCQFANLVSICRIPCWNAQHNLNITSYVHQVFRGRTIYLTEHPQNMVKFVHINTWSYFQ